MRKKSLDEGNRDDKKCEGSIFPITLKTFMLNFSQKKIEQNFLRLMVLKLMINKLQTKVHSFYKNPLGRFWNRRIVKSEGGMDDVKNSDGGINYALFIAAKMKICLPSYEYAVIYATRFSEDFGDTNRLNFLLQLKQCFDSLEPN